MECLSENTVVEFVQGLLPDPQARLVEAHLDRCSTCLAVASDLAGATGSRGSYGRSLPAPTSPEARVRRGTRLGRYVIERMIGAGAMGFVYAAFDDELGRRVAIKVVRTEWSAAEGYRARLSREARAIARVNHPNVVTVHDIGTVERGVFIAMELVEGGSLREWLEERPRGWREIVRVASHAGRGLAAAHDAGIVHRDFKPENVLVGRDGRVVVADFGLARTLDDPRSELGPSEPVDTRPAPAGGTSTATGAVLGTPAYMAPEQHRGAAPDARSDQYSFCVVLHEALYGERPHVASGASAKGRDVPHWLRRVLKRGLEEQPADRYPSMHALVADLDRDPRPLRRSALLAATALALLVLAGGVGWRRHVAAQHATCKDAAGAAARAWSPERRSKAREAFARTGLSYADATWRSVERTVEAYTRTWSSMREQVCEEELRWGASKLGRNQEACLADRLAELDASTQLLAGADAKTVQNAVPIAQNLAPLARCADPRALATPSDPAKQAQIAALKNDLARARALHNAGKYHDAHSTAEGAAEAADALGDPQLQADAQLLLGVVSGVDGDAKKAEAALMRATALADAAADDRTRAQAWIGLMSQVGYEQYRYDVVPLFDQQARAALARLGGDDLLEARRRSNMGLILKTQGKFEEASVELEAALALKRARVSPDTDELATTWLNLGTVRRQQARYEDALGAFREALRVYATTRGADAPANAVVLNDIADALVREGKPAEGLEFADRAVALGERQLGPAHPALSVILGTRAEALIAVERREEARRDALRGVEILEKRFGASTPRLVPLLTSLGRATRDPPGAPAEALAVLERGYALSRPPFDPVDRADLELALARAICDAGGDRRRARELAAKAESVYSAASDTVALREVAAWKERCGSGDH